MTSSDAERRALLDRARRLLEEGFERASVVDVARADELVELYDELGQDAVVLQGAVPDDDEPCDACLVGPGLVTVFVRKR